MEVERSGVLLMFQTKVLLPYSLSCSACSSIDIHSFRFRQESQCGSQLRERLMGFF
jgi:hypothetical protein